MRKFIFFFFVFLFSHGMLSAAADANQAAIPARAPAPSEPAMIPVDEIKKQTNVIDEEWNKAAKIAREKYQRHIERIQEAIEQREQALDHGDAGLRKRWVHERKSLEIERDHLKRRLASISAAGTVDWVKLREDFEQRLKQIMG